MNKKHILLFILCLLTAVLLPFNAMAADKINTNEKCSFSVSFIAGEKKAEGVEFKIYRVADISSSNKFSVTERFRSYPVSYDNIADSNSWRNLSQTLLGYIVADRLQADATAKTAADGRAYFYELPVGLYLVTGGQYISGNKIYTPQTYMIRVPSKGIDGEWKYDLISGVKCDVENDVKFNGMDVDDKELEILKIWDDNSNPDRPQEIEVEIYCDDTLYDTVVLDKSNNWKYELKNLSKKAIWTVVERFVPDGYTVSVERQDNRFVFTNTNTSIDNPKPTTPPHSSDNTLPQTGLLWWPVPCLLAGGLLVIIIGSICRRGTVNEG